MMSPVQIFNLMVSLPQAKINQDRLKLPLLQPKTIYNLPLVFLYAYVWCEKMKFDRRGVRRCKQSIDVEDSAKLFHCLQLY